MKLNILNYLKLFKVTPFCSSCNPSTIVDKTVLKKHLMEGAEEALSQVYTKELL
jgi:hypothetical protein